MFWIKNQLRFLPHPLNLLRDLAFFHHFHTFFSQFSHFQSPYQSIATNFASLPGSTKALGEAARHLQPFQPLKKPDFYRVLWWIYLCVTQNSLGKKTNIWASTIKCPCSTGWFDTHLTKDLTKLTVIPIFNLPKPTTPYKSSMYIVSNLPLRLSYFPLAILPHHLRGWGWPDSSCWKRLRKSSKATCSWQRYTPSHLRECLLPQKETHLTNPAFPRCYVSFSREGTIFNGGTPELSRW